jgi:hypothetical protein
MHGYYENLDGNRVTAKDARMPHCPPVRKGIEALGKEAEAMVLDFPVNLTVNVPSRKGSTLGSSK